MKMKYTTTLIAFPLMLLVITSYAATNSGKGNIETIILKNNTPYTLVYSGQQLNAPQERILLSLSQVPPGGQTTITGISLNYGHMPFKQVAGLLNFNAVNGKNQVISHNTLMLDDQPEANSQAPINQFMRSDHPAKGQLISKMVNSKWDSLNSPFALQRIQATISVSALSVGTSI